METRQRILLVDDDQDFVAATRDLLELNGYEVFCAYDGNSGVSMAQEAQPDLLILDVMMATRDEGFDVSRRLRAIPALKEVPVILLTGIRKAMGLPFGFAPDDTWLPVKAVLEKPVEPERLLKEIATLLRPEVRRES